ncbi:MAG: IS3 family transposase [Tateyamaria sp.]|nr:IS3 family transposase [Tateyamaria sp.]
MTILLRLPKLVAKRPNYGYPRIRALLNGDLRSLGLPPVNNKRVYRIMANSSLLLE